MTPAFASIVHFRQQLLNAGVALDAANMMIRCILDYHHTGSERAKERVINSLPAGWQAVFNGNEVEITRHEQAK